MTIRHVPFDGGTRIELMVEDQVASGASVNDRAIRIGNVVVRCGGIGGVGTGRKYRMKGYSRRTLAATVEFMQEEGYHISALYGIPNYYTRWGFAPAMPDCRVAMATRDAETAESRYAIRRMEPEDVPAVLEIYTAMTAERTGSVARMPGKWTEFQLGPTWTSRFDSVVVEDGDQILGYFTYNLEPWDYAISEVGYRSRDVWQTLIAEAAKMALERRVEKLTWHLPADDPFVAYGQRYGMVVSSEYARNAHCMARVIDQTALLGLIEPLLVRRVQEAGVPFDGTLLLETDLGSDQLSFGDGATCYAAHMPQSVLAQLVLGYRSVADALFETGAACDPEAIPVLDAAFPQGFPYTYCSDRY